MNVFALLLALALPATPTHFVTDTVGALSSSEHDSLENQLQAYHDKTGHQVIVYVTASTGGTALEDWTSQAGHEWKIGDAKKLDGAILFVFTKDKTTRIEVGYGLEGDLTDAKASQIVQTDIVPKLKTGDIDGGVQGGVNSMLATITPGYSAAAKPGAQSDNNSTSNGSSSSSSSGGFGTALFVIALFLILTLALAIVSALIALIVMIFKGPASFWPTFWRVFRFLEYVLIFFFSNTNRRSGTSSSSGSDSGMSAGGGDFGGGGSSGKF